MSLYTTITIILVSTCIITYGGSQNCNDVPTTITSGHVELLVNRSISPYCLQCLDSNMMPRSDAQWVLPGGKILTSDSPSPPEAELVNGVLVLLDPMTLLMDGPNSYRVQCRSSTAPAFRYLDIKLYSSALVPPTVGPPLRIVAVGDNVTVNCYNPNSLPVVQALEQWFDPNGNRALAVFATLTIPNITWTQAGEYRCVLTSTRGETASASVTITISSGTTLVISTSVNLIVLWVHWIAS